MGRCYLCKWCVMGQHFLVCTCPEIKMAFNGGNNLELAHTFGCECFEGAGVPVEEW